MIEQKQTFELIISDTEKYKAFFMTKQKEQEQKQKQEIDFPILKIVDTYLLAGGRIELRHDRICLVDRNGEYLASGETMQKLLLNCIFTFC